MYFIRSVKGTTSFPCGKHLVRSKMMCLFWITTSLFIRFKKKNTQKTPLFKEESNFFPDRPRLRQDYPLNLSI